ncbi:hypothetical protein PR202_ga04532 [Eleusine coracana subsp. coracana]|uniref:Uncharacterized protein n=1 Tax=Eleusine coracana subsp. coracana TaxID=191504 RepID=A0AAV5BQ48_ELECO|nr:hypothetical protein PR202_ga04532 [Eleusine coracana subsp. coracana]
MARGFLKLCGAALIFMAGWKAKEKTDDIFGVPKPATVLAKVTKFWNDISAGGGATEKKKLRTEQEWARREADMRAELHKEFREAQVKFVATLTEEIKKLREVSPEDHHQQRDGNSRPPSRSS